MIVGSQFEGDDDVWTMWVQHDAYRQSLAIIVGACRDFARLARGVVPAADPMVERFLGMDGIDHRNVQQAHDLIAAFWRHLTCRPPALPFVDDEEGQRQCRGAWLTWLRHEVDGWLRQPTLVRALIVTIATEDGRVGDEADALIHSILKERFADMYRIGTDLHR